MICDRILDVGIVDHAQGLLTHDVMTLRMTSMTHIHAII